MPFWKVVLFSTIGLVLPVLIAVIAAPFFFNHISGSAPYVRGLLDQKQDTLTSLAVLDPVLSLVEPSSEFREMGSSPQLNPSENRLFIVAAVVRLSDFPHRNERQRVFYKYSAETNPYPGWAFAIHRSASSIRPQVYWQGLSGKGGWLTFAEVPLSSGGWYSFALVAQGGEFVSLYWQKLTQVEDGTFVADSPVRFCGGFEISDVGLASSEDPLYIAPAPSSQSAGVQLSEMLVAKPNIRRPSMQEVVKLLDGGVGAIAGRIKQQDLGLLLPGADMQGGRLAHSLKKFPEERS